MVVNVSAEGHSEIAEFYRGRSVFITGGTGFMGKVLIERLLSTCPGVERLYLLLRHKKAVLPGHRLQQLKDSQLFNNIRLSNPSQLDKLEVIEGNIVEAGLGLPPASIKTLQKVSLVFHVAATVKFDEDLKTAVAMNVLAPLKAMELSKQLPDMEAFIHVSTAYSNCDYPVIEERVFPPPVDLAQMMAMCEVMPQELLDDITSKYIGKKPNTYIFTKAMGENAVVKNAGTFPVAIFRPTIVGPAYRNPCPGWVDSYAGPSGIVVGVGKGVFRIMLGDQELAADLLPVDMAIDTLIAVGWQTAIDRPTDVRVFNCATGPVNSITWGEYMEIIKGGIHESPFDDCLWYPFGSMQRNKVFYHLEKILLQIIPAYFVDYGTWILGIKTSAPPYLGKHVKSLVTGGHLQACTSLVTANQRLSSISDVLTFFTTHQWQFKTDNVQKLKARLSPADSKIFNLDPATIDWRQYCLDNVKGTRKYLLKEKDQDLVKAQRHLYNMSLLHHGLKLFFVVVFTSIILRTSETARGVFNGTFKLLLTLIYNSYQLVANTVARTG